MDIRKMLAEMDAMTGARPADQMGNGDQVGGVLSPTPEQEVDGSQANGVQGGRPADQVGGTLEVQPTTPVADPVGAVQHGQGTEVQGNTYGTPFAESFASKLAEATEFSVDVAAIKGLMESQELSEEFQTQAAEIFASAVNAAVVEHVGKVNAYAGYVFEQLFAGRVAALEEEVDGYLNHVVAEWVEENRIAIEQGIRNEVAESLMSSIKATIEEHYVDLPEAKKDLYVESVAKVEELEAKLEEAAQREFEQAQTIASMKKAALIESKTVGMSQLEATKIRQLAEGLEFESEETFAQKLGLLSEATSRPKTRPMTVLEDVQPVVEEAKEPTGSSDPEIAHLAKTMSRFAPRK